MSSGNPRIRFIGWATAVKFRRPSADVLPRKTMQFATQQAGYQIWQNWLFGTAGIGASALIEGVDVVSATGSTSTSGSATITEGSDTSNATGGASTSGSAAIVEGHDTPAGSGVASTTGSSALTEASDVVAGSGASSTSGTGAITEGHDTPAASGSTSTTGSASLTEGSDVVSATGVASLTSSAAIVEGADVSAATGASSTSGTAAIAEAHDTTVATGSTGTAGSGTITEAHDPVNASGAGSTIGLATIAETSDITAAVGLISATGIGAIVESLDVVVGVGVRHSANDLTEGHDIVSIFGNAELMHYGYSIIDTTASYPAQSTTYIDIAYYSSERISFTPVGVWYRIDDVLSETNLVPWTQLTPGHTNEVKVTPSQNSFVSQTRTSEVHQVLFQIVDVFGNTSFASGTFTLFDSPTAGGIGSILEVSDIVQGHS